MVAEWAFQSLAGSSIWAAMMLMPNTKSSRNMEMMPAWPGVFEAFLDSSLRLVAVSQPQKKNTPSTSPAERAEIPAMEKGFSHDQWNPVDPAGWLTATLMIPQIENPMTAAYSMISSTHWKLVVHRIPQMQMKVIRASHAPAVTAAMDTELAVEFEIQPSSFMNCRVYWSGHDGGRDAEQDARRRPGPSR